MSLENWMLAVITASNLVGRLEVVVDRVQDTDEEDRSAWADVQASLQIHNGFLVWYGGLATRALIEGITLSGSHRPTGFAKELMDFADEAIQTWDATVSLEEYAELVQPHVECFLRQTLLGPSSALVSFGQDAVWGEVLEPRELERAAQDFGLRLGQGSTRERFAKLLAPSSLEQIASQDYEPPSKNIALVWKRPAREKLAAALGGSEDEIVPRLILRARQGRTQTRKTDDLLKAEQMKILLMDLVLATSDAVLSILSQAQQSDLGDRETIDCILAGMLALRHNYREAVEPFLGVPDTRGQYSAEFLDQIWELLKTLASSRRAASPSEGNEGEDLDMNALSPLTRQVALILEAVQFNPFGPDDQVDLTSGGLENDLDRRTVLLPIGEGEETREPIAREEFVARLRETLSEGGSLLEV